jgi:hypothetical protein
VAATACCAALPPLTRRALAAQGLEWFARVLRQDDDGDVADEFLEETSSEDAAERSAAAAAPGARGRLRPLPVTRRPRLAAWARVAGGWPLCADPAAAAGA